MKSSLFLKHFLLILIGIFLPLHAGILLYGAYRASGTDAECALVGAATLVLAIGVGIGLACTQAAKETGITSRLLKFAISAVGGAVVSIATLFFSARYFDANYYFSDHANLSSLGHFISVMEATELQSFDDVSHYVSPVVARFENDNELFVRAYDNMYPEGKHSEGVIVNWQVQRAIMQRMDVATEECGRLILSGVHFSKRGPLCVPIQ